jgi:L-ascorbate metabolism protein UlaG (beta-lactamase superfamily)
MVHADHSSGISTEDGGTVYGGEAAGFVVTLENGLTLYHGGDTNVFSDMSIIHELYAPDVALLPIGGHFTMSPKEAAYAVKLLKPKVVIPMHYGTFEALAGTPQALKDLLAGEPVEVLALEPGGQCREKKRLAKANGGSLVAFRRLWQAAACVMRSWKCWDLAG